METEISEDKQSLSEWREAVESLAAFATAGGGEVHFGINPKGERVGIQLGKGSLENLANNIRQNTDPPLFPAMTVEGPEQSAVLRVKIEESPLKPVWAFGRPFRRVGRTNQKLPLREAQRLMATTAGNTWDALSCPGLQNADMDTKAVRSFLKRAELEQSPVTTVLKNLSLTSSDGAPSNAAALLFSKNPQRFVVEAQVKCARFADEDSIQFLDERTLVGNLFSQLDEAQAFIVRNTRQGIRVTGKPQHDVVPEYPEEAIREALINAICHRDYAATGTVQIRIYDSRLEVWNPGLLPEGMVIRDLYGSHASRPHNPHIAGAFHRARLIEHWGTGTVRMLSLAKTGGIRVRFSNSGGFFVVVFEKVLKETAGRATPSSGDSSAESRHQVGTKSAPSRHQVNLLRLCAVERSLLDLMKVSGRSDRTKFRGGIINPLIESGWLTMTLPDKPKSRLQRYILTEAGVVAVKQWEKDTIQHKRRAPREGHMNQIELFRLLTDFQDLQTQSVGIPNDSDKALWRRSFEELWKRLSLELRGEVERLAKTKWADAAITAVANPADAQQIRKNEALRDLRKLRQFINVSVQVLNEKANILPPPK